MSFEQTVYIILKINKGEINQTIEIAIEKNEEKICFVLHKIFLKVYLIIPSFKYFNYN